MGACGAGAAGSESQPYLEGAGSGDPAYRGRHRGGGFIWGAVGYGLLGVARPGDPADKGGLGRRDGFMSEVAIV